MKVQLFKISFQVELLHSASLVEMLFVEIHALCSWVQVPAPLLMCCSEISGLWLTQVLYLGNGIQMVAAVREESIRMAELPALAGLHYHPLTSALNI